jgi:hypothetical protein
MYAAEDRAVSTCVWLTVDAVALLASRPVTPIPIPGSAREGTWKRSDGEGVRE